MAIDNFKTKFCIECKKRFIEDSEFNVNPDICLECTAFHTRCIATDTGVCDLGKECLQLQLGIVRIQAKRAIKFRYRQMKYTSRMYKHIIRSIYADNRHNFILWIPVFFIIHTVICFLFKV